MKNNIYEIRREAQGAPGSLFHRTQTMRLCDEIEELRAGLNRAHLALDRATHFTQCLRQQLWDGSLEKARDELHEDLDEGVECKCCGQLAKRYKRKLNSGMAKWLIRLCDSSFKGINIPENENLGGGWVDTSRWNTRGGDHGKLRHWGLIELAPNDDSSKRTSGIWRPTRRGIEFATNRIRVPTHIYLYDNKLQALSSEGFSIADALGSSFDYSELMKNCDW